MRLLYITSSLSPFDGYGRYSRAIVNGMAERGHEVDVLVPRDLSADHLEGLRARVTVHATLESPRRHWQKKSVVLGEIWRSRGLAAKADLIHCLVETYYGLAGWISGKRAAGWIGLKALVLEAVGSYAVEPFVDKERAPWGHKQALRGADCVCAISRFTLDQLSRHAQPRMSQVIHLGVEEAVFGEYLPSQTLHPTVLSVGTVKPRKGILELIEAAGIARARMPGLQLHIVGDLKEDPQYAKRCAELIKAKALGETVILHGRASEAEVRELARSAWCFALCPQNQGAKFEGFGLVYVEAAARGLASVATQGCGAEEFVEDGKTGLLVPQGSAEAIAGALEKMLGDEHLRESLAKEARKRAWEEYRWERCLVELEGIYKAIMNYKS